MKILLKAVKHLLIGLLTVSLIAGIISNPIITYSAEGDPLDLKSRSAILMEASTGRIIYEKNADEMLRPASVTKIMTLLLTFEELDNNNMTYDDIVTVSEHAASMGGSQCFFEAGEEQTVRDMIKCIEVASGNDAAVAMAEHIAGSETEFVNMMNTRAKELGMNNTNFVNACGLEAENHLTTARDIAIMSRELITKHPEIKDFSTIWMDSIIHKTKRGESQFDLANTNKFLNQYTGATGLKTGFTSQAKYCMSATASRNGIELIAVIMGADTKEIRNSEACKLLDYGFSKCNIYNDTETLPIDLKIPVKNGTSKYVDYNNIINNQFVLVNESPDMVIKEITLYNNLEAPIYEGDTLGVVQYSVNGNLVHEEYIYAAENVEKLSYIQSLKGLLSKIFMIK
ncbi:MAG: D-alanyl-D-alanine carboxypeptidase [Lachnospiraceae bacterium]|nr:D-alanyl-D-alanine carboxypeptidase [Lachnospiraceae bacterium]MBQ9608759.1 D-alanyl-D-alanine carboxypeptidase [Lachnospiraceae bacterium]